MRLLGKWLSCTLKSVSKDDKMDEQRNRDLEQEWIKAMAVINGIVEEAIDEGKIAKVKTNSKADENKNNSQGNIELTFISGAKLKAHIELDFKAKHRTHRAKGR